VRRTRLSYTPARDGPRHTIRATASGGKAKKEGLRARSAFKLDEIQRRFHVLRPGGRVLDLGAARAAGARSPRARWGRRDSSSDSTSSRSRACLPRPRPGFADAFAPDLPERLRREGRAPYDAVLSDLAPKTSGVRSADEARSLDLAGRALGLSLEVLKASASSCEGLHGRRLRVVPQAVPAGVQQVRVVRPEASVAREARRSISSARAPANHGIVRCI